MAAQMILLSNYRLRRQRRALDLTRSYLAERAGEERSTLLAARRTARTLLVRRGSVREVQHPC